MRVLILIGYTPRTTIFTSTVWGVSANLPTIVGRISSFKHEPNFVVGGILVLLVVSPSSVVYIRRPRLQQGTASEEKLPAARGKMACNLAFWSFRQWQPVISHLLLSGLGDAWCRPGIYLFSKWGLCDQVSVHDLDHWNFIFKVEYSYMEVYLTSIILFSCTLWDSVPGGSLQWSSSVLVWFPWWLRHGAMNPFEGTHLGECWRTDLWIHTF